MALAGNGRWTYLDPKLGAMHAVAEAARKVACTGATPVAATNCLNFGNPEKPEIMAQLSQAIDGIAEACTALGTPVTGGNVSLYNETKGEGIYPTPVLGVVGIIEDVTKAVPSGFQRVGDTVILLTLPAGTAGVHPQRSFGSSEYAKTILGKMWGAPPDLQLLEEFELQRCLVALCEAGVLQSASDVSDGGLAVALAECCFRNHTGVRARLHFDADVSSELLELFGEDSSLAVVSCAPDAVGKVKTIADEFGFVFPLVIGETIPDRFEISLRERSLGEKIVIDELVNSLKTIWAGSMDEQLAGEVVTA
jgi:phosphoribosylformylglycinamidine synthase